MKIELRDSGLRWSLDMIENDLKKALACVNKRDKDICINKALGAVKAIDYMVRVRDDAEETENNEEVVI